MNLSKDDDVINKMSFNEDLLISIVDGLRYFCEQRARSNEGVSLKSLLNPMNYPVLHL